MDKNKYMETYCELLVSFADRIDDNTVRITPQTIEKTGNYISMMREAQRIQSGKEQGE